MEEAEGDIPEREEGFGERLVGGQYHREGLASVEGTQCRARSCAYICVDIVFVHSKRQVKDRAVADIKRKISLRNPTRHGIPVSYTSI